MKILFITNIPTPYRHTFFNLLGKKVDLTVLYEAKNAKDILFNSYSENNMNYKSVFLSNKEINEKKINFKFIHAVSWNLYDFIIVTNYAYLTELLIIFFLRFKKINYIIELDGSIKKSDNFIVSALKRFIVSGASNVFSPSHSTDEFILRYGFKKNIIRYNFTSLNSNDILNEPLSSLSKSILKAKYNINNKKVILSVGQFIKRKGFDLLISIANRLNEDTLIIIIGGKPNIEYLNLIKELNINNVIFKEFMDKKKLFEHYQMSDVFVMPTRFDIWGLVVNEAMANGIPVISSNNCVAGIELIDHNNNGYLFESGNKEDLFTKLNQLINNKTLIDKFSKSSLIKIKNYTIERMVNLHIEKFLDWKNE